MKFSATAMVFVVIAAIMSPTSVLAETCPGPVHLYYQEAPDGHSYEMIVRANIIYADGWEDQLAGYRNFGNFYDSEELWRAVHNPTEKMRQYAINAIKQTCISQYNRLRCDSVWIYNETVWNGGMFPLLLNPVTVDCGPRPDTTKISCNDIDC